ncbi:M42 family metallopeptidase [Ferroacidibacillus organovorans]|uniref:Peptidase M42 n=1 Tax=Ferroacidibacillus organovorans TaxID=1765683 RepID=A0A1V4EUC3_9BACL|nr:M42 family metallopeptidase [Ferroacidibacillus organovorans]OPG16547.1 peptidase M42 [Ferroacidibacillus organovorans]
MLLKELTEAFGPSGFEGEVRDLIRREATPFAERITTDTLGSLIVEKNLQQNGPKVLLAAHMDEVSFMIVGIEENGLLRFRPIGGVDPRILVSKVLHVGSKRISGVIGAKAIHLQKPEERKKPLGLSQLFIDIGASTKAEAESHVAIGDTAVFATRYEEYGDRRAKAKSFDDRVGCAILLEALKEDIKLPLVAAFTVQEEIGLRGAGPVAFRTKPDFAIVLEGTVCFDVVDAPAHGESTILGAGPALTLVDSRTVAHRPFRTYVKQVAEENGIPVQMRRVKGGSNDNGIIHLTEGGIVATSISVPVRYIHAPVQSVHLDDVQNAYRLLISVLRGLEKGGFPG